MTESRKRQISTFYKEEFDAGRVLVTVQAGDRSSEAAEVLRRYGAYDITSREPAKTVKPDAPRQTVSVYRPGSSAGLGMSRLPNARTAALM